MPGPSITRPPPRHGTGLPSGSQRPERPCGGADKFLAALEREIVPHVESALAVDGGRRTLWGHSYGGLFALFSLTRPHGLFRALAIASPTLWWDEGEILHDLQKAGISDVADIVLTKVENEKRPHAGPDRAEDPFSRLTDLLAGKGGPRVSTGIFPGADHRKALDLSIPMALELADS